MAGRTFLATGAGAFHREHLHPCHTPYDSTVNDATDNMACVWVAAASGRWMYELIRLWTRMETALNDVLEYARADVVVRFGWSRCPTLFTAYMCHFGSDSRFT